MLPPEFYAGLSRFNAGEFWHAHEEWERCWLRAEGQDAAFYQALIQAAAALVKWRQGNRRGLGLNWAKSRARLETLPPLYHGIDLADLREHMDRLVAGELSAPPTITPAPAR